MADVIRIALSDSSARSGVGVWNHVVVFEPLPNGHRVRIREFTGRFQTIRRSRHPCTWRSALQTLLKLPDAWLDSMEPRDLNSIAIDGVPDWASDMLRMAVCQPDGPLVREVHALARLSDDALHALSTLLSRDGNCKGLLVSGKAIERIREISGLFEEYGRIDLIDAHLRDARGDSSGWSTRWIDTLRLACMQQPYAGPTMRVVRSIRTAESLWYLSLGSRPRRAEVRAELFRKWVELALPLVLEDREQILRLNPHLAVAEWLSRSFPVPGELTTAARTDQAMLSSVTAFQDLTNRWLDDLKLAGPGVLSPGPRMRLRRCADQLISISARLLSEPQSP